MDWETLKTDCLACQRCPLHTTRHNVVFGQGVPDAEVLFVGEGVKCRPPQNRDPLPAESEACMPWLREQFRLLRPKIVVCLGRIAAQRMIRADFSVTKEHGTFIEKNGILFMGTFHPAALLRQPQNKPEAFGDFVALRDKIHEVCEHTY